MVMLMRCLVPGAFAAATLAAMVSLTGWAHSRRIRSSRPAAGAYRHG